MTRSTKPQPNTKEGNINMATINLTLDEVLDRFAELVALRIADANGGSTGPAKSAKATKSKAQAEPEPDDDSDDESSDDPQAERRAELSRKRLDTLKKIAIEAGFPKKDVNATTDKTVLIESILADEAESDEEPEDEPDEDEEAEDEDAEEDEDDESEEDEDESDEEDEEEDEEDESEEEGYDREALEGMNLRELKAVAKEAGYSTADIKGLDQDGLVDFLVGEDAEEDDEDEEEEDSDEYSEEELLAMKPAELRALAKEWGIKVPATAKTAKAIVKVIYS